MQVRCVQACKVQRGQVRTGRRCAAQGDIGKVPRSQALRVSTSTLLDSLTPSPVMHPGRPVEVAPVSPVDRGIRGPWTPVWRGVWAAAAADVRDKLAAATEGAGGGSKGRGAFFGPVGVPDAGDAKCWDEELARELWEWSERTVGVESPPA